MVKQAIMIALYFTTVFQTRVYQVTNFIGNGEYEAKIANNNCVLRTRKKYFNKDQLVTYPKPLTSQFNLLAELPVNKTAVLKILIL